MNNCPGSFVCVIDKNIYYFHKLLYNISLAYCDGGVNSLFQIYAHDISFFSILCFTI